MSFPDTTRIEVVDFTPGVEPPRVTARTESGEWAGVTPVPDAAPLRAAALRLKVDAGYLGDFLAALDASAATGLEFTLPGYDLFSMGSEANLVQVVSHSSPVRDREGVEYTLDLHLEWIEALS